MRPCLPARRLSVVCLLLATMPTCMSPVYGLSVAQAGDRVYLHVVCLWFVCCWRPCLPACRLSMACLLLKLATVFTCTSPVCGLSVAEAGDSLRSSHRLLLLFISAAFDARFRCLCSFFLLTRGCCCCCWPPTSAV